MSKCGTCNCKTCFLFLFFIFFFLLRKKGKKKRGGPQKDTSALLFFSFLPEKAKAKEKKETSKQASGN
jgi:preprotein translocase subunit YajC